MPIQQREKKDARVRDTPFITYLLPVIRLILTVVGLMLTGIGILTIWTPIPIGLPLLMIGIPILMKYSPGLRYVILRTSRNYSPLYRQLRKIKRTSIR